ncbi:fumarylacetoacetate hydrolase family protein [Pikeienuella piscinae]|uniref:Fumarylacetoacetate hydrolase family protein n=1 Tax=Pikeienuella piscinae TaxID=2748098 RepID=A0A7L5BWP8_9RHOB|nr:fumarylacetoacetate hydrolase family protein [Pikeienuella piscinae]QIE56325.1 fumarylacetoacetate hydrolase family protein [Pikeienuella piscinae]
MKYLVSGGAVWALAPEGGAAVNLSVLDPAFGADMMGPIGLGRDEAMTRAARLMKGAPRVDIADLRPEMPVARPGKILCLGHNYVDHIKEGGYEIPEHPAIFVRTLTSMTAAEGPMVRPKASERFDFEVELMIVIGKAGRAIPEEKALEHIFGYTVFNDGSLRDYQRRSHQWTPGKNFDRTGPVGPVVTDAGELGDAGDLRIESRLNGQVMQSATTKDMMWPVPAIIRVMSEFSTLEPGDMIATGTPPGVGHARKPPVFMAPGDVIECEIEGIGICRNTITDEA